MKTIKKTTALLLVLCLLAFTAVGCGTQTPANQETPSDEASDTEQTPRYEVPEVPSLTFTFDTLPKIDGATALAPYYEAMAACVLQTDIDTARQYVQCSKTDGAYDNLINGSVDMIFCSMPSSEQQAAAEQAGVQFETTPFLNGGFVFFVNKDNPVDSLSIQQLHDIYTGEITNWSEVGGEDKEIVAFQRPNNSGSQTGMYKYVCPEEEIMEAPTEKVIASMEGIIDAVAAYDNAEDSIGYSYYYYVANMHYSDKIKLLQIDGIEPSDETIGNGTYPIINPSLMVIRADTPEDSPVRQLIDWVCSDEGKAIAVAQGYIPKED